MPSTAKAKHLREVLRPLPAEPVRAPTRPPYRVAFYLVPNFPMMAFAAAIRQGGRNDSNGM
jgi:hypothetical protein